MALYQSHPVCLEASPSVRTIQPYKDFDCLPASGERTESEMIGSGPAMRRLRLRVQRLGPHFRTVLLRGEAGSGKELAARQLHRLSGAAGPFVVHREAEKIAAQKVERHRSAHVAWGSVLDLMVKRAEGGTIYLDGVSGISPEDQAKLMGVLRRQDNTRALSCQSPGLDVRIIVSTCHDHNPQVSGDGLSRQLYERLLPVEIAVPPLRARKEDLPELTIHLLHSMVFRHRVGACKLSEEALGLLEEHDWPGNVSELRTVLEQAMLRCDGAVLESRHLAGLMVTEPDHSSPAESMRLEDVVERHVVRVLQGCAGNKLRAAEMLGVSRSTLYRMLEAIKPESSRVIGGGRERL